MFNKKITCFHCKGKGVFHSGPGAVVDAMWNCPTCKGVGYFIAGLRERVLIWFQEQLYSVHKLMY